MSYEAVDIYVLSTEVPAAPITGVVVKVYSSSGSLFYTEGLTDAAGKVSFLLPNDSFSLRFYKFAHSFTQPVYIVVDPTIIGQPAPMNSFNIYAEVFHRPQATDPRTCLASGYFRSPTGGVGAYVDMHFIAKFDPILLEGAPVLIERVSARTDEKGYVQVSLIRCGIYDVILEGYENIPRTVTVPDEPWVNIGDLLFTRVSAVTFTPNPNGTVTIPVGTSVTYDVQVATTARYNLPDISSDVAWKTDDYTKVAFQLTPNTITINALAVGTTYIRAERRDNTIIAIPNTPVTNGVLEVVVV
jgi:hypothetical protein